MNRLGWLARHPTLKRFAVLGTMIAGVGFAMGVGASLAHSAPAFALTCPTGEVGSPWGCVAAPNGTGTITVESSGSGGSASTSGSTISGSTSANNGGGNTIHVCTGSECALTGSYSNTAPGDESVGNGQYTHDSCASSGEIVAFNGSTAYCSPDGCASGQEDVDGVCQDLNGACSSGGSYPQWTFSSCVNGTETETSHNTCTGASTGTSTVSCGSASSSGSSSTPTTTVHHTTGGGTTTITSDPAPTLGCPSGETLQLKSVTTQDCSTSTTYVSTGCHRAVASSRQVCKTTSYACESAQNGRIIWRGTCHSQSCRWVPTSYHTVCGSKAVTSQTCTPVTSTEQVCAAPPAPACTAKSTTTCDPIVINGCSGTGKATGYEECTTTKKSASCAKSIGQPVDKPVSEATTGCTAMVQHQCAPDQPGYAERQTCLTDPAGGLTGCKGWSAPYYDPKGCPVPTPVDIGGL